MPQVPYKPFPTNEPSAVTPNAEFHPNVSANTFGGHIAQGLQQFGQGMEKAAGTWGEIQKDYVLNNAIKEAEAETEAYSKLQGQSALDAEQGTKDRLDQIAEKYRNQLPSGLAHEFDTQFRPYQYRYLGGKISTHAIHQSQVFTKETNESTGNLAGDMAASAYNDPAALDAAVEMAKNAAVKQVQAEGNGNVPVLVENAIKDAESKTLWRAAEAMYAHNAPDGYQFVKDHEKALGVRAAPLMDKFRARALEVASEQKSDVIRRIWAEPDPTKRQGLYDANRGILKDISLPDIMKGGNVVPIRPGMVQAKPGETESQALIRQARENLERASAPAPLKTPSPRLPGETFEHWRWRNEGVDAHTDRNLFSSGAAARHGIAGGVGQNLTDISDGQGHTVKVNESASPYFSAFLHDLTSMGYKINAVGGFNDRNIAGTRTKSEHAYGNAIDINENTNQRGSHTSSDLPPNIREIAARHGLIWGGDWIGITRDPMHFEWSGKSGIQVAGQ